MNLDLLEMLGSGANGMIDSSLLGPLEGYQAASAAAFGMTLMMLGEQLDRAVENLCDENAALRELFGRAAPSVGGTLADRLERAAAGRDETLRISALKTVNDGLRALLIDLHVRVEEAGGELVDLETAIWSELVHSTERRQVAVAPF